MGTWYDGLETGSLAGLLEIILQSYETEYRAYWGMDSTTPPDGLDEEDWRFAKAIDTVTRKTLESVHALSIAPALEPVLAELPPTEEGRRSFVEASSYVISHHGLEIEVARLALDRISSAAQRVRMLVWLVSRTRLGARAAAYLDRATRLYVWGFGPECIVMCRSILEAALQDRIDDGTMAKLGFERKGPSFALVDYIRAAERMSLFGPDERGWAHEVRLAGNDAVHVTPGIEPDAFTTLMSIAILIRKLFPS